MKIRERASKLLAVGALAICAAIPVTVSQAPVAYADGCGGGGGFVPFVGMGGGGGCTYTTPDGNIVQCGGGHGTAGALSGGGGACHIFGGPAGDFYCDISVQVMFVWVDHQNPCPPIF